MLQALHSRAPGVLRKLWHAVLPLVLPQRRRRRQRGRRAGGRPSGSVAQAMPVAMLQQAPAVQQKQRQQRLQSQSLWWPRQRAAGVMRPQRVGARSPQRPRAAQRRMGQQQKRRKQRWWT